MLPVVYDPVVAQAIERYSHEYRRPDGYLSVDDIDGVAPELPDPVEAVQAAMWQTSYPPLDAP